MKWVMKKIISEPINSNKINLLTMIMRTVMIKKKRLLKKKISFPMPVITILWLFMIMNLKNNNLNHKNYYINLRMSAEVILLEINSLYSKYNNNISKNNHNNNKSNNMNNKKKTREKKKLKNQKNES